ncbi:MAG: methionyl-tRNA formyltransferase [Methylococcaceae bacterium]
MKILIFSLGEKGFSVIRALTDSTSAHSIWCVIGQDDGVDDDHSSRLATFCDHHGIGYSLRNDVTYSVDDYDIFLAVGWRWIIRDVPQEKLIVFHDSLLPRYRGFAPLVNALINKERMTGVTALLGAEEYDKGNILIQNSLDITYPTNIEREIHRISIVYANLVVELLEKLNIGTINRAGYPQNESEATYSLWRDEEDYRIDWDDDANNIEHFISCVNRPYRGASAVLNGIIVRILKAQARSDIKIENRSPGKVVFVEANLPVVVCGSGLLVLADVRNELGESILPLKSFRSRFC